MKRFIQLSAIARLCNVGRPVTKQQLRSVVRRAIFMDQAFKARRTAGGIGLS